jgi:formate dehydrogenase major subunit
MKNHGCHPFGNAKARAVVWNFPDPIPSTASRCTAPGPTWSPSTRRTTTRRPSGACPRCSSRVQEKNKDIGKTFPLIMTSGRLVEYEGGGEETRSNPWLAELQQDMFVEINPKAANDRGIRNGDDVWVKTPPMKAVPEFKGLREGAGHRAGGRRHGLHAVPLLRPLGGVDMRPTTPRARCRWSAARRSTPPPPTATTA